MFSRRILYPTADDIRWESAGAELIDSINKPGRGGEPGLTWSHHQRNTVLFRVRRPTDLEEIKRETTRMETVQELVPFVREMLSQKPNRGMLKVYLLGTVVAVVGTVVGTVVGLVDTMCHPFSGEGPDDAEMAMLMLGESRRRTIVAGLPVKRRGREQQEEVQGGTCLETDKTPAALSKTHGPQALRTAANRLHAS
ncbi:unnamed protein product [Arctogadus glacialis]